MTSVPAAAERPAEDGDRTRRARPGSGERAKDRLVVVDAVRALALLGVLVMNLRDQSGLDYLSVQTLMELQGPLDRAADFLLEVLVDKKFLSAFSFLFGLSFTLLLADRNPYSPPFLLMYTRRLLGLAFFGLVNIAFFFWGDILLTYAALGALLLLFVRLPLPLVLVAAFALLVGTPVVLAVMGAAPGVHVQTADDLEALAAFTSPSWLQSTLHGFDRYFGLVGEENLYDSWDNFNIMGLFLLGLWVGRKRIPQDLAAWRPLLRKVAWIALPLGFALSLTQILLPQTSPLVTLALMGTPILAIGYMATVTLLLDRPQALPVATFFAAAGRCALTNYLAYGFAGQLLFYGWALGWQGATGTTGVVGLAILTFVALLLFSHAWLARFKMGPAEWLWRCFTKLEVPDLRRAPARA